MAAASDIIDDVSGTATPATRAAETSGASEPMTAQRMIAAASADGWHGPRTRARFGSRDRVDPLRGAWQIAHAPARRDGMALGGESFDELHVIFADELAEYMALGKGRQRRAARATLPSGSAGPPCISATVSTMPLPSWKPDWMTFCSGCKPGRYFSSAGSAPEGSAAATSDAGFERWSVLPSARAQ